MVNGQGCKSKVSRNFGRVYFLLRSISPSQIHLRFKTEKPSQIHLKCEKGYILKSTSSDNLLKTISRHTRWTFSIRIPSQILLKSPSSDNLLKTISRHTRWTFSIRIPSQLILKWSMCSTSQSHLRF